MTAVRGGSIVVAAALLLTAAFSAAESVASDTETVRLVELFVSAPTSDLPPEKVPEFLAVDPKALPAKLRTPWLVKREELLALKKIADGSKKPPIRRIDVPPPGAGDCVPLEGPAADAILRSAGYSDIEEAEEEFIMEQTKCSECELMVEFTLEKALKRVKGKKGEVTTRAYYFLHPKDPLWTLVGAYRAGNRNPFGTPFFGIGHPHCH